MYHGLIIILSIEADMSNAAKQLNPEFRVVGCTKHMEIQRHRRDNRNGPFPSVVSGENPLRDTVEKMASPSFPSRCEGPNIHRELRRKDVYIYGPRSYERSSTRV